MTEKKNIIATVSIEQTKKHGNYYNYAHSRFLYIRDGAKTWS